MDAEQWDLLRVLVTARQAAPDSYSERSGIGGEVFSYQQMGEGQFIIYPGLPDGRRHVRALEDMMALMDQQCIQMRKRIGDSYTFVLTPEAYERAAEPI